MFPTSYEFTTTTTTTYTSSSDHQTLLLDKFLSSADDVAVCPNNSSSSSSRTLPPPFLFPVSPSFVNDVDEFVSQHHHHHHHHLDLLTHTSTETLADESVETTTTTTTYNHPYNTTTATLDVVVDDLGPNNGKGKHHHSSTNYGKKARDLVAMKTAMRNQQSPRRRSAVAAAKKDRHSKIVTAQGPRDRRMRLSLDIARRFFDLQDMLHFDKASKTVEWLLTKSRSAIKELSMRGFDSETKNSNCSDHGGKSSIAGGSSTSEPEVVSGVVDADHDQIEQQEVGINKSKEKRTRQARKATLHPVLARESRDRARARARERTMERLRTRSQRRPPEGNADNSTQLRSCSSTDYEEQSFEELGTHQSFNVVKSHNNKSLEEVADDKGSSHSLESIIKKANLMSTTSAPCSSIFNYADEGIAHSYNSRGFVVFDENWDLQSFCANTITNNNNNNRNSLSTGEVFENYTQSRSCSLSMHNFDTCLQSHQFADHNHRF